MVVADGAAEVKATVALPEDVDEGDALTIAVLVTVDLGDVGAVLDSIIVIVVALFVAVVFAEDVSTVLVSVDVFLWEEGEYSDAYGAGVLKPASVNVKEGSGFDVDDAVSVPVTDVILAITPPIGAL